MPAREATVDGGAVETDSRTEPAGGTSAGVGAQRVRGLVARGRPEPHAVAHIVQAHPGERAAIFAVLHASLGNSFVQTVLNALETPSAAPMLGFDDPFDFNKPRVPTTTVPMTNEKDLEAVTARGDVERLLTAKGMDASEQAGQALEILLNVPDSHRGKVIDKLAQQAFDNLLDRISEADRERFARLVDVSEEPTRKLRLWAAAHKSRATNDIARKQGDIGGPLPYWTDDDGEQSFDDEAEEELRKKLTKEQLANRKRHLRRQETAVSTRGEVDTEVKALMAKAKAGQLTLGDVDAMRERKELEYKVEQTHNVNLTTQKHARAYDHKKGENVVWEKDELAEIDLTLGRLDHAKDPDAFKEIQRTESHGIWDGVGGVHHGDSIEVRDGGATTQPGYRHGGDKREGVSDDFKRQHGNKIGTLEFVLTHEIGHDYADKHQKTFEAFKTAAGWEKVTLDALVADGVSAEDIETIQKRVENPTSKTFDVAGRTKTFNSTGTKDEYWAVPKTAIPAQDEAEPGVKGDDAWFYARANPAEHFAETYAKAVHVPEKLHEDLIVKPAEAVTRACEAYEPLRRQIAKLEGDPRAQVKLANLRSIASALKAELSRAEAAQKQRAAEFALMRDGVFGTDKAVKISLGRLEAKHVTRDKIELFQERAAKVSTPEQVAVLEAEASK